MRPLFLLILLALLFIPATVFCADPLKNADVLRQQKKYDEARQEYLKIATGDGDMVYIARVRAAQCLIDKKDYIGFGCESTALLEQIPQTSAARVELELTSASLPFQQKKWKTASTKLADFAASHPGTIQAAQAMALQGEALGKQKKYDEAREVFFKITQDYRDTTLVLEARHQAANLLFDSGKYQEFEIEASALMAMNPPVSDRYVDQTKFALAKLPETQGKPLESAQRFEAYMAENPKRFHFEHHIAELYFKAADQFLGENKIVESQKCRWKGHYYIDKERKLIDDRIATGKLKADDYHARYNYLETYSLEKDFDGLIVAASKLSNEFPKPTKVWAAGMYWRGIAKYNKRPQNLPGSAADLDAVLNSGVVDTDLSSHLPTQVAILRIAVAESRKDKIGLKMVIEALKRMPEGPVKKEGMRRYARIINVN